MCQFTWGQLVVIVSFLVKILLVWVLKSNPLLSNHTQRLNIDYLHNWWHGFAKFLGTLAFLYIMSLLCGAVIFMPSFLLLILCFMLEQKILRLIIITLENRCWFLQVKYMCSQDQVADFTLNLFPSPDFDCCNPSFHLVVILHLRLAEGV